MIRLTKYILTTYTYVYGKKPTKLTTLTPLLRIIKRTPSKTVSAIQLRFVVSLSAVPQAGEKPRHEADSLNRVQSTAPSQPPLLTTLCERLTRRRGKMSSLNVFRL